VDCSNRRAWDFTGIPEMTDEEAWDSIIASAKIQDLDQFRSAMKAYARAIGTNFNLQEIEKSLREDKLPVYLIAKETEIAQNYTIVDLMGNINCKYVLTIQLSDKPRRARMNKGWPKDAEENIRRLASAGFIQERGIPICARCNGKITFACLDDH
jgi:hypothetical protein